MFSSEKNVETIARLLQNSKRYGEMRLETFERSSVEKITTLVTSLIIGTIIAIVGFITLVFLSAAVALAIAPHVGGYAIACLLIGAVYLVLLGYIYVKRQTLIATPIRTALRKIFFEERAEEQGPSNEEMEKMKEEIEIDYELLRTPATPGRNKWELAINAASRTWALVDSMILGYKLYKKFTHPFLRKRR